MKKSNNKKMYKNDKDKNSKNDVRKEKKENIYTIKNLTKWLH